MDADNSNVVDIVAGAIETLIATTDDHYGIACAAIGALTGAGYVIVRIDHSVLRRAMADMQAEDE